MTHPAADLLRAIADGKQMEIRMANGEWWKCMAAQALQTIAENGEEDVRIARTMVTRTVEYPEPLKKLPPIGKPAWCISPEYTVVQEISTETMLRRFIAHGMAFATEADAAEAHKALFGGGV